MPKQDIINTLYQMSRIAEAARGESDPVLVYRRDELHVIDPFLSFYLRHSAWESTYLGNNPGQGRLVL